MIRGPLDNGRWQVYGRRDGRQVYVGTVDSKREAQALERRHMVTMDQIAAGELPPDVDTRRTFGDAIKEWLASLLASKARSHASYVKRCDLYLLPTFEKIGLDRITKGQVLKWRDEHATKLGPSTVNGALTCMSSAFRHFVDRGWVDVNPCRGVKRVEVPPRMYTWIQSREEITRLLVACVGELRDVVALALGTGMRVDELLHLQWTDVDLERRLIAVHRGRQGTVKSGKARHVPILDNVLGLLRERALRRGGATLVFPGRTRGPVPKECVRSVRGIPVAFKKAVVRAGLDRRLRFHDLRHSFASHWVLDRGDIFRLSRILGHSTVVITQQTYAHLVPAAWEQDYARVSFAIPNEASVYEFKRGADGRLTDRVVVPLRAAR